MYSVPQNEQLAIFGSSLGLGFLLGILYDIMRAIRLSLTKSKIVLIICDILYFILFALISFLFILALNKGEIRFYIIAGEVIGAFFYYVSFGLTVIKITDKAVALLRKLYALIFKCICTPFKLLIGLLSGFLKKLHNFFKKTEKKSSKIRKNLLPKLRLYVYNLFGVLSAGRLNKKKGGRDFGKTKEE